MAVLSMRQLAIYSPCGVVLAVLLTLVSVSITCTNPGGSRHCPPGTSKAEMSETLFGTTYAFTGCQSPDGTPVGEFEGRRRSGRDSLAGQYKDGQRSGRWVVTDYHLDNVVGSKDFWFSNGVNQAIAGGPLQQMIEERESTGDPSTVTDPLPAPLPSITSVSVEKLLGYGCDDCSAYSVTITRDGVVRFAGYSAIEPMGERCGSLPRRDADLVMRLAQRLNPEELADVYEYATRHPKRLAVLFRSGRKEKLVQLRGPSVPEALWDFSLVVELLIDRVLWLPDPPASDRRSPDFLEPLIPGRLYGPGSLGDIPESVDLWTDCERALQATESSIGPAK